MVVSLKTDLRFPIPGQQGYGDRIIHLSECYAEAYDEKLDYYVDKAMSAASNAFAELAEEAKDEADMLLRQIEELETLAKKVLKLFKSLPLNDIRIDNTKK